MNQTNRPTVYDSAIDPWIVAMMLIGPIVSAVIGLIMLSQEQADGAMYLFLVGAATILVTIACTLPCRYTILDDSISIRCGLIFYQIPLDQITSVEPSASWASGPALSMRRVKIKTDARTLIVSPRQRETFIDDLTLAAGIVGTKS